jgi:prophage regulatory protein
MEYKILKLNEVISLSGFKRSTIYLRIKNGLITRPVQIGKRSVGWPSNEIHTLIKAAIGGFSDNEIRIIVINLEDSRKIKIESLLTPPLIDLTPNLAGLKLYTNQQYN